MPCGRPDLLVIGGGPAGLMAAGTAAQRGLTVILLEKMPRCGRKLRITGKGRCNLTSAEPIDEFPSRFGRNGLFLRDAFKAFDNVALQDFFASLGVPCVTERGSRVFPESQSAQDVLDALLDWTRKQGAIIRTDAPCKSLSLDSESGAIRYVTLEDGTSYAAAHYLIACGGASYPLTGSTGDGARLAQAAGHAIVPLHPALIPLETAGDLAQSFQGVALKNATATLLVNGKPKASLFGELLFTHFGLSGPVILSLSKEAGEALQQGRKVEIALDLKPALTEEQLEARLIRELQSLGARHTKALLRELLPAKMVEGCLAALKLPPDRPLSQMTVRQREALRGWLKRQTYEVTATRPLEEAIVTAGGVRLKEVDPRTMRSRICPNLSLAGEVLDLDAITGGFNLQAAFSTGRLAGLSIPKETAEA